MDFLFYFSLIPSFKLVEDSSETGGYFTYQSILTAYILPGQPPGKVLDRSNPGHPGKLFCLISRPETETDYLRHEEISSEASKKRLKNWENYKTEQSFYLENF